MPVPMRALVVLLLLLLLLRLLQLRLRLPLLKAEARNLLAEGGELAGHGVGALLLLGPVLVCWVGVLAPPRVPGEKRKGVSRKGMNE